MVLREKLAAEDGRTQPGFTCREQQYCFEPWGMKHLVCITPELSQSEVSATSTFSSMSIDSDSLRV